MNQITEQKRLRPWMGFVLFAVVMAFFVFVCVPLQSHLGIPGLVITELGILAIAVIFCLIRKVSIKEVFPIFLELLYVLLPLAMWVVVNWSITTLFEGKATMKVIFITTVNALIPLILLFIPQIILSYFFTLNENVYYVAIGTFAVIWSVWNLMKCNMELRQ